MAMRNELETQKMQQEQWEHALAQLREARDMAAQEHHRNMEKMKEMTDKSINNTKQLQSQNPVTEAIEVDLTINNEREEMLKDLEHNRWNYKRRLMN